MTQKKNSKRRSYPSKHHIIPKDRGGNNYYKNISIVNSIAHNKYHSLFGVMTPDEIIKYLVNYFWRGENKWVNIYINEEVEDE